MVKTLGQRIRELREERDLSLRELAKKLGVSAAFLSDVELDRRHPSDRVLVKVAQLLNTSVDELRTLDTRPAVEELKRLARADPAYGFAFRQIVDSKLTSQELLDLLARKPAERKKR
jgi:transcriptional regulator with XRE-family HTH domain